jgi:predicted N-formylglutamate amidohydrolase
VSLTLVAEHLLAADEPGPFELVNPEGRSSIVLVCDHASNRVPRSLGTLGLDEEQLQSHIAWDPGSAELARKLSAKLDATLLLSNYSRLIIDCNRSPGEADSIPAQSAGIEIPGNQDLTEQDANQRRQQLFDPYQQAISNLLDSRNSGSTKLLSIHSFTPVLNQQQRPWAMGVCYDHSKNWARKMLRELRKRTEEMIGDNQPYSVEDDIDYTIPVQGEKRGLSSVMLEMRQDKLRDDVAVQRWCNLIAECCG